MSDDHGTRGSGLAPWPARLTSPPPRLADFGYSSEMWEKDTVSLKRNIICLCLSTCCLLAHPNDQIVKYAIFILWLMHSNFGGGGLRTTGIF